MYCRVINLRIIILLGYYFEIQADPFMNENVF